MTSYYVWIPAWNFHLQSSPCLPPTLLRLLHLLLHGSAPHMMGYQYTSILREVSHSGLLLSILGFLSLSLPRYTNRISFIISVDTDCVSPTYSSIGIKVLSLEWCRSYQDTNMLHHKLELTGGGTQGSLY